MTNTQTPAQIDTKLADLYGQAAKAKSRVDYVWDSIHRATDKQVWEYGTRVWTLTNDQALIALVKKIDAATEVTYQISGAKALIVDLKAAKSIVKGINAQIAVLDAIFAANPWSRFFIVTNANGHIHSTMHCSTCYPTTQFGWNPQLSGKSEAEAVAELGEILCTVCFPSAPVAWTAGISKAAQTGKDERAAAKAARQAKAVATGISNPDGTPLRGRWGIVKAERTAQSELVDLLADQQTGYDHDLSLIPVYAAALAYKRSQTVEEVLASIAPKVAVKVKAINEWKNA